MSYKFSFLIENARSIITEETDDYIVVGDEVADLRCIKEGDKAFTQHWSDKRLILVPLFKRNDITFEDDEPY